MSRRILFSIVCVGFVAAAMMGCSVEYRAIFSHKAKPAPPKIIITAGYPNYQTGESVEFKVVPQKAEKGWMGYKWEVIPPEKGAHYDVQYKQEPDSGIELSDKVYMWFHVPGIWKLRLIVAPQRSLRCRDAKCRKPLPNLPYRGGQVVTCPACKGKVHIPAVGGGIGSKAVTSKPEEILIINTRPRRLGGKGRPIEGETDSDVVSIFPRGGWVFVGERFQVSLFGVQMYTDAGGAEFPQERYIKKVEIEFGDGTKREEYGNSKVRE
ncbi:MAG: hypothetical protein ACYTFG_18280, partial [Planctomycetota bacterium]